MQPPSRHIVSEFAAAFAQSGPTRGMTPEEIVAFFRNYANNVTDPSFFKKHALTKIERFEYCLDRLYVDDQYRALIDLCTSPPLGKYPKSAPDVQRRDSLLASLYGVGAMNGLTIRAVLGISRWDVRREWIKTVSRIEKSPAAAITSARACLETVCRSVIATDADHEPKYDGDLGKLIKATRNVLGLTESNSPPGIGNMVNGLAQISNAAGDRHGVPDSDRVFIATARFACDCAFALSLLLLDLAQVRPSPSTPSLDPD